MGLPALRVAHLHGLIRSSGAQRKSFAAVAVVRPRLHQRNPFAEQIAAPVRGFDFVGQAVRQRVFAHFARERIAIMFGAPVTEGRAKSVNRDVTPPHAP